MKSKIDKTAGETATATGFHNLVESARLLQTEEITCQAEALAELGYFDDARELMEIAAEQNDCFALYWLCILYQNDSFGFINESRAFLLASKGAANGSVQCMYLLGGYYASGKGTKRNIKMAHEWVTRASELDEDGSVFDSMKAMCKAEECVHHNNAILN